MFSIRHWSVRHASLLTRIYNAIERLVGNLEPLLRGMGFDRMQRLLVPLERLSKGLLFNCQMCGDCLLGKNGMSCPMNCPKKIRNGPCGGVRPDGHCEVDAQQPCVWVQGWHGGQGMRNGAKQVSVNPVAEHHRQGSSAWLNLLDKKSSQAVIASDAAPAASRSGLANLLEQGAFVVTSEVAPPDSAAIEDVSRHLQHFAGFTDALNVIDSAGGNCHMSSIATSSLLARAHCEPIMQMTCRDRNRIAIQGDVLGAAALGIHNVLCLTGDHVSNGDDPGAKPVFDLDALTLLETLRTMRDQARFRSGRQLTRAPDLFLGAVANPFSPPLDMRPYRLARKIAAGAQFVQTQYCFDVERLREYMSRVIDLGLTELCHIIVGVGPISSAKTARWLRSRVPGVHIPNQVIDRLQGAVDQRREGKQICIELIQQISELEGVSGIHLMAPRQEFLVPEIMTASGVLRGRSSNIQTKHSTELKEDIALCHFQD